MHRSAVDTTLTTCLIDVVSATKETVPSLTGCVVDGQASLAISYESSLGNFLLDSSSFSLGFQLL